MGDAEAPASGEARDWTRRRADARRNHERVLAAAIEIFTEHGLDATIPQIAARAGVGKATVYRSYPTKADLIEAIAMQHIDWLHSVLVKAAAEAEVDAFQALSDAVGAITARLAKDRLMVEVLGQAKELHPEHEDDGSAERILALGRQQGTLREDITLEDLQVLLGGMAHVLLERGVTDAATWERYTLLTMSALRP